MFLARYFHCILLEPSTNIRIELLINSKQIPGKIVDTSPPRQRRQQQPLPGVLAGEFGRRPHFPRSNRWFCSHHGVGPESGVHELYRFREHCGCRCDAWLSRENKQCISQHSTASTALRLRGGHHPDSEGRCLYGRILRQRGQALRKRGKFPCQFTCHRRDSKSTHRGSRWPGLFFPVFPCCSTLRRPNGLVECTSRTCRRSRPTEQGFRGLAVCWFHTL